MTNNLKSVIRCLEETADNPCNKALTPELAEEAGECATYLGRNEKNLSDDPVDIVAFLLALLNHPDTFPLFQSKSCCPQATNIQMLTAALTAGIPTEHPHMELRKT